MAHHIHISRKAVRDYVIICVHVLSTLTAVIASSQHKRSDIEYFDFDVNDILNGKLMPVQIFSQQLAGFSISKANTSFMATRFRQPLEISAAHRSDLNDAFTAMGFHRRMINEFLAAEYLTHQILNNKVYSGEKNVVIHKRMGTATNASMQSSNSSELYNRPRSLNHNSFQELLDDEGMAKYKSWLDRTTTLKDIQRQMSGNIMFTGAAKDNKFEHIRKQSAIQDGSELEEDDQNFEDGDITGYALANNPYDYSQHDLNQNRDLSYPSADMRMKLPVKLRTISKTGYDHSYDNYGPLAPPVHLPSYPPSSAPTIQGKEIGLKDITDIAMTTLAFLSFGMFILQVLMCITMGKEDVNNMMVLPMDGDGGDIPEGDGTEEIRRKKRSVTSYSNRLIMV